jgi:hypothetical protein
MLSGKPDKNVASIKRRDINNLRETRQFSAPPAKRLKMDNIGDIKK